MRFLNIVLLTLTSLAPSLALPIATTPLPSSSNPLFDLFPRQTCLDTCGNTCYYSRTVDSAQSRGYSLLTSNDDIDSYPHIYNNWEGFDFPISGPYYEYPILRTFQVYNGGSPGPDRVIFNAGNQYGGLITHERAGGSAFVECN